MNNEEINHNPLTEPIKQPVENREEMTQSIHTLEGDLFAAVKDENYGNNIVKIVSNSKSSSGFKPTDISAKAETFVTDKPIGSRQFVKYALIIAIVLIVAGVGAVIYLGTKQDAEVVDEEPLASTTTAVATTTVFKSAILIDPEAFQVMDIAGLNKNSFVREMNRLKTTLRDSKIVPYTNVGITLDVDVNTFFQKLRYSGSETLLRSLTDDYSFGLYSDNVKTFEPYLLIKVNSFDQAFAGTLEWEPFMPVDLKEIFAKEKLLTAVASTTATTSATTTATSTATTTVAGQQKAGAKTTPVSAPEDKRFTDQIIKNIDTRIYTDKTENLTIVYGFINKEYLLITGGPDSFVDIRNKLLAKNILR